MPPSPIKEVRDEVITKDGIDCPECGEVFESEDNLEMHMDELNITHPPLCAPAAKVFLMTNIHVHVH